MLNRFRVRGFKSLRDVTVDLPELTVVFGPNATGKSNLLDAIQVLSRCATKRTLTEALTDPVRGLPAEAFSLPSGGLPELLRKREASFELDAWVDTPSDQEGPRPGARKAKAKSAAKKPAPLGYGVQVLIEPGKGALTVGNEYLARLRRDLDPLANMPPRIEKSEGGLCVRRLGEAGQPRREPLGEKHTILSDRHWSGKLYPDFDRMRRELEGWRTYYLDPRVAMRAPRPPREVDDIGVLGEDLAPFLYRLKHSAEHKKRFAAVVRVMRNIIPTVKKVDVLLDERHGTLDIQIEQDGTPYSSRIVSEGTLRLLALAAISVNPWPVSLVAFEEPENGVHPRRLEIVANVLTSLALDRGPQVIVTTHSPRFVAQMVNKQREFPGRVALLLCRRVGRDTQLVPFRSDGPLLTNSEIRKALTDATEEDIIEAALIRGWLDA